MGGERGILVKFQPLSVQEVIRHRPLLHYGTTGTANVVELLLWKKTYRRVLKWEMQDHLLCCLDGAIPLSAAGSYRNPKG